MAGIDFSLLHLSRTQKQNEPPSQKDCDLIGVLNHMKWLHDGDAKPAIQSSYKQLLKILKHGPPRSEPRAVKPIRPAHHRKKAGWVAILVIHLKAGQNISARLSCGPAIY